MVPVPGGRQGRHSPDRKNDDKQDSFQRRPLPWETGPTPGRALLAISRRLHLQGHRSAPGNDFMAPPVGGWLLERFCRYSFQRLGIPSVAVARHAVVSVIVPSGIPIVKHYFSELRTGCPPTEKAGGQAARFHFFYSYAVGTDDAASHSPGINRPLPPPSCGWRRCNHRSRTHRSRRYSGSRPHTPAGRHPGLC